MAAVEQDVTFEQGADWATRIAVTQRDPDTGLFVNVDLTGGAAIMNVGGGTNGAFSITEVADAHASQITLGDGFVDVLVTREELDAALEPGKCEWELFVKPSGGRWMKWYRGRVDVEGSIS
jgi:hypothetical protein